MKILKKPLLMFLSTLMLITNININILADDTVDPTYTATYEFVLDSNQSEELPDEVLTYLPKEKTDLKTGEILTNDKLDDVVLSDTTYSFVSWNYDEYTISDTDIHFIGTWKKTIKAQAPSTNTNTNTNSNTSSNKHKVSYVFFDVFTNGRVELPKEIMQLLPAEEYVDSLDNFIPKEPSEKVVGTYEFHGYEVYKKGDDVEYHGVWYDTTASYIRRRGTAEFGFLGQQGWGVSMSGYAGTNGFSMNGNYSYCIQAGGTIPNYGVHYSDNGSIGGRIPEIVAAGEMMGKTQGQRQAAIWNYLGHYATCNGVYEDPNEYRLPSGYAAAGTVYELSGYQTQMSNVYSYRTRIPHGYINIRKVASSTTFNYVQNCPNNYSLQGAEYGVYTNAQCTNEVATLITDASGNTPKTGDLTPGTYYVKEKKASPGFRLDSRVYPVTVSDSDTPVTVTSTEPPIDDPLEIVLYKQDKRNSKYVPHLDEAEFTLKYYDANTNNPTGTPLYTWVFKPIFNSQGEAVVVFDKAHYVSGPNNLWNSRDELILPLGTFTIEETKAPAMYARDTNVYVGHVVDKGGYAEAEVQAKGYLEVNNQILTQTENLQTVSLTIQKVNQETGLSQLPTENITSTATLQGAVFRIYRTGEYDTSTNPQLINITPIDYGTVTTDASGKAQLLYERVNGVDTSDKLLPGKFKIVEEKAPNGFTINTNEFIVAAEIRNNNTANFEYTVTVAESLTQIQIEKLDHTGSHLPASANAIIQLIETATGTVVYEFTYDGSPKLIKGLSTSTKYHLHELSVNPNYQLSQDIDVTPIGENDSTIHYYHMIDNKIDIHTTASFDSTNKKPWDNTSNKHYVADGIAHIFDAVTYTNLTVNDNYLLVGSLYDLTTNTLLPNVVRHPFVPRYSSGQETVEFTQDLTGFDNHVFVVYEELYHVVGNTEVLVTEHKDNTDADQTIYVDKLYTANFEILKVDADTRLALQGVEFNIKTSRTRRDGTLEEVDLGKFTTDANGKITINNLKEDTTITVTETKAHNHSYFLWQSPFTYNIGHDPTLTKLEVSIDNQQVKLSSKAFVKETGTSTVKADGIVTVVDTFSYEWLNPNKDYVLKGKIYDLSNNTMVADTQMSFNKNEINGSVNLEFTNFDLRNYPNKDLGISQELYVLVDDNGTIKEEFVKSHNTNLQDANQMIHVQKLHTAAMVLYKIGSNNQNIKLSGAYFNVKTSRTRLDGVVEEYDLGTFLTGGIFHTERQHFNFIVAKDDQMTVDVKTYSSYKHSYFPDPIVSILGLEDGTYYGKVEGSSTVNKYYIAKGMIFLPEQIEDTLITYQELIAPIGYDLDKTAFSFSVGHDYSVDRVTNYRSNHLTFIPPKTGIE